VNAVPTAELQAFCAQLAIDWPAEDGEHESGTAQFCVSD
jgi:hypothetical protein